MTASALWNAVEDALALEQPPVQGEVGISRRRRRGFSPGENDLRATLQLQRDTEGLLRWEYLPPARRRTTGRRIYRSIGVDQPEVLKQFRFMDLEGNDVTRGLQTLDWRLTPTRGLMRLDNKGAWVPAGAATLQGRALLLVHGTFSRSQMYTDEFRATGPGAALLQALQERYAHVLAFDHPTLAVGAWSNAIDLVQALAAVPGPIDIVCHSRGGRGGARALRLAALDVRRLVFVGSPLTGTSLASPAKLRAALDMLANYAEAIARVAGIGAASVPLAAGAAGLARIFGRTLRLGSSLPITDAAVSLVPGLASQQRISNNLELNQLFGSAWKAAPEVSAVRVNFRPLETDAGWQFWKRFTHLGDQFKFAAADLIFPGSNDLVVDTEAMVQLGEGRVVDADRVLELGTSASTHHTSYFRSADVVQFLDDVLKG
jgi:pimeloyl-ACP methyl ester carboxylesterase